MAIDYGSLNAQRIRRNYFRNKLIAHDANNANDLSLLYGDAAESIYLSLVNGGAIVEGSGAVGGAVESVAGRTGVITLNSVDITDSTTTGRGVLKAADSAAARSAIGAGTSSLALGTTGSTAKAGNYAPNYADAIAGSVFVVTYTTSWPARPTARTDIIIDWTGPNTAPTNNAFINGDRRTFTP